MQQVRTLSLLPHQHDLIADEETRILGLVSGYGGGKTFAVARKACTLMLQNPGCDGIVTEPNYPLLTQILIPEIKTALEFFNIPYTFSKSDSIFYCMVQGKETRIICKSMEAYERLIGVNAAWVILDEFDTAKADLAYSAYLKLLGRIRSGKVRQMVIVSTPEGFGAMHRIFILEAGDNKRLIRAKTTDNKYLPLDYIDTLKKIYTKQLLNAYLEGQFVNLTAGNVFNAFHRDRNRSQETVRPKEPLHIGCDFNVTKMCAVVHVLRDGVPHAVAELINMYDTPAMIEAIKEKFPEHHITVYPDASGGARKSVNAAISDLALIRQAGLQVRANSTNPAIKDRVTATNVAFEKARYFVNPDTCKEYTAALEQLAYDKNGMPNKSSGLDHCTDAGTYYISYAFPVIKRTFVAQQPTGGY